MRFFGVIWFERFALCKIGIMELWSWSRCSLILFTVLYLILNKYCPSVDPSLAFWHSWLFWNKRKWSAGGVQSAGSEVDHKYGHSDLELQQSIANYCQRDGKGKLCSKLRRDEGMRGAVSVGFALAAMVGQ